MTAESGGMIVSNEGARGLYNGLMHEPAAMASLTAIGQFFMQSQIMGCKTPGDGIVMAMTCFAEAITPLQFSQTFHIIQGRPAMRADAMLAKFRSAGGKVKWVNVGDDGKEARAIFAYGGDEMEIVFTIDDAEKVIGRERFNDRDGNWSKSRGAMLRARLVSKALRIISPELVSGTYLPEEIEESLPPAETAEQRKQAIETRREELRALEAVEPVAATTTTTTTEDAAATEVRKRGRPRKTEATATPTVAAAATQDQVVDVASEPVQPKANDVPFETNEPTSPTTGTTPTDASGPVAMETLQELVALGEKLGQSIEQVRDNVCEAAGVQDPTEITASQGAKLVDRYKAAIKGL